MLIQPVAAEKEPVLITKKTIDPVRKPAMEQAAQTPQPNKSAKLTEVQNESPVMNTKQTNNFVEPQRAANVVKVEVKPTPTQQ